ncbi:MAG: hypothetical protein Q9190_005750, partial [Brigantiaea leucoxantha]
MLGSNAAAALGVGLGGGGGPNARLSQERKHRMRELATQKLSQAYHLDEIAASVATMQSASALEEVARLVLQRNPTDSDAKYVHFFHEKIPSRTLAQCTSLKPLDEMINDRPVDGCPLRTRALTKILKEDYSGAIQDLTKALAICRFAAAQHSKGRVGNGLPNGSMELERKNGDSSTRKHNGKLKEDEQPKSLEPQLYFHRAGVHLVIACEHIYDALNILDAIPRSPTGELMISDSQNGSNPGTSVENTQKRWLEAQKIVKINAKRALRDYMSFLGYFEYTPGASSNNTSDLPTNAHASPHGLDKPKSLPEPKHSHNLEPSESKDDTSNALTSYMPGNIEKRSNGHHQESATPFKPPDLI